MIMREVPAHVNVVGVSVDSLWVVHQKFVPNVSNLYRYDRNTASWRVAATGIMNGMIHCKFYLLRLKTG